MIYLGNGMYSDATPNSYLQHDTTGKHWTWDPSKRKHTQAWYDLPYAQRMAYYGLNRARNAANRYLIRKGAMESAFQAPRMVSRGTQNAINSFANARKKNANKAARAAQIEYNNSTVRKALGTAAGAVGTYAGQKRAAVGNAVNRALIKTGIKESAFKKPTRNGSAYVDPNTQRAINSFKNARKKNANKAARAKQINYNNSTVRKALGTAAGAVGTYASQKGASVGNAVNRALIKTGLKESSFKKPRYTSRATQNAINSFANARKKNANKAAKAKQKAYNNSLLGKGVKAAGAVGTYASQKAATVRNATNRALIKSGLKDSAFKGGQMSVETYKAVNSFKKAREKNAKKKRRAEQRTLGRRYYNT